MLFTTFLLATAAATALFLGTLLARRQPDAEPLRVPYGLAAVLGIAGGLTVLGLAML